jgi:hypothetical protein
MKTKVRYLTIIFIVCLATGLVGALKILKGAENRPTISRAEQAYEMLEVQNCFSKHAYYHAFGFHRLEMEDIWVKKNGDYSKTVAWTNNGLAGYDAIWKFYVTDKENTLKKNLEKISRIVPEIKNVPENLGAGGEWAIHMQTTPIIEVAGDGKTAKGVWYTPGVRNTAVFDDGKVEVQGAWFMERYAVDFVKEDGKWKIWHFQNLGDPEPPGWGVQKTQAAQAPAVTQETAQAPGRSLPNNIPKGWNPKTVPVLYPKFPEPYYTFSETFSY